MAALSVDGVINAVEGPTLPHGETGRGRESEEEREESSTQVADRSSQGKQGSSQREEE